MQGVFLSSSPSVPSVSPQQQQRQLSVRASEQDSFVHLGPTVQEPQDSPFALRCGTCASNTVKTVGGAVVGGTAGAIGFGVGLGVPYGAAVGLAAAAGGFVVLGVAAGLIAYMFRTKLVPAE